MFRPGLMFLAYKHYKWEKTNCPPPPLCSSIMRWKCIFSAVTVKLVTVDVKMDEDLFRKVWEENLLEVTKD